MLLDPICKNPAGCSFILLILLTKIGNAKRRPKRGYDPTAKEILLYIGQADRLNGESELPIT
jgi:hypothetical protein